MFRIPRASVMSPRPLSLGRRAFTALIQRTLVGGTRRTR